MDFDLWWKLFKWILVNFEEVVIENTYMFVDWVVIGEHIYVNWIVNVLVSAYMSCDDELLMNSYMHIYWWYCLCEHMHWVESYVHAYMTDGDGDGYLYPNVRRGEKSYMRCVNASKVTTSRGSGTTCI